MLDSQTGPSPRPLLGVIYDIGSAGPADFLTAARDVCEIAFICDTTLPHNSARLATLRSFGAVVELEKPSIEQLAGTLTALWVNGVATASEFRITQTAEVARICGLRFHDTRTARLLTDKFAQRQALREAGVQTTRSHLLTSMDDVAATVSAVGLPAILKPRHGAGSVHTYRIDSVPAAVEAIENAAGSSGLTAEFVLEELLHGDPDILGPEWGDYVSVESLAVHGDIHHVCIMGKFPLAEPFRETGQFAPAKLPGPLTEEVLALADGALRAVGFRDGVSHTEIKLTPAGPRIIEINGRIGGYVTDVLRRASGFDLLRAAIQVAVDQLPGPPEIKFRKIAFRRDLAIPHGRSRLLELHGVEELRRIPGIEHVELKVSPGQVVDSRMGTQECLGEIHGSAPDHAQLQRIAKAASTTFRPVYESLPEESANILVAGRPVR